MTSTWCSLTMGAAVRLRSTCSAARRMPRRPSLRRRKQLRVPQRPKITWNATRSCSLSKLCSRRSSKKGRRTHTTTWQGISLVATLVATSAQQRSRLTVLLERLPSKKLSARTAQQRMPLLQRPLCRWMPPRRLTFLLEKLPSKRFSRRVTQWRTTPQRRWTRLQQKLPKGRSRQLEGARRPKLLEQSQRSRSWRHFACRSKTR
mmetsp:Transcript_22251/g.52002  ORF Transcript_22251/g.52002 Transcript_22251/m.52002 type:complete len:204 (+) Transcript_22251:263-874(+)